MTGAKGLGTAVVLLACLAGCAYTPDTAPAPAVQRIQRVAVVSTVGDVLLRMETVESWGLDTVYEDQLGVILQETRGLTVVKAARDRSAFSRVNTGKEPDWGSAIPAALQFNAQRYQQRSVVLVSADVALYGCAPAGFLAARALERRPVPGQEVAFGNGASTSTSLRASNPNERQMPATAPMSAWPGYGPWTPATFDEAKVSFSSVTHGAWYETLHKLLGPATK
jgi:hypothetical protein